MFEEGKENMKGREMGGGGVWMGKEEGEQLKEIVGLVGESSEILARTVGEGVKKMMTKNKGRKGYWLGKESYKGVFVFESEFKCAYMLSKYNTLEFLAGI